MAKFLVFLFVAFVCNAALAAPVHHENGAPHAEDNKLEQLIQDFHAKVEGYTKQLQASLPDSKDITDTITNETERLIPILEKTIQDIETELEKTEGNKNPLVENSVKHVREVLKSMKEAISPESQQKGKEVLAELERHFKSLQTAFEPLDKFFQEFQTIWSTLTAELLRNFSGFVENIKH